jgi:hypothetical protein
VTPGAAGTAGSGWPLPGERATQEDQGPVTHQAVGGPPGVCWTVAGVQLGGHPAEVRHGVHHPAPDLLRPDRLVGLVVVVPLEREAQAPLCGPGHLGDAMRDEHRLCRGGLVRHDIPDPYPGRLDGADHDDGPRRHDRPHRTGQDRDGDPTHHLRHHEQGHGEQQGGQQEGERDRLPHERDGSQATLTGRVGRDVERCPARNGPTRHRRPAMPHERGAGRVVRAGGASVHPLSPCLARTNRAGPSTTRGPLRSPWSPSAPGQITARGSSGPGW